MSRIIYETHEQCLPIPRVSLTTQRDPKWICYYCVVTNECKKSQYHVLWTTLKIGMEPAECWLLYYASPRNPEDRRCQSITWLMGHRTKLLNIRP